MVVHLAIGLPWYVWAALGGLAIGLNFGGSSQRATQSSKTFYPNKFLDQFQQDFGGIPTSADVAAALPQTTSLFGPTQVPGAIAPSAGGAGYTATPLTTPAGPATPPAPRTGSDNLPGVPANVPGTNLYSPSGLASDSRLTGYNLAQQQAAQTAARAPAPPPTPTTPTASGGAPGLTGVPGGTTTGPPPGGGLNAALPGGVAGSVQALGFGAAPPVNAAPATPTTSTINAPEVTLPGGSLDAYRNALFEAQFRPVATEIARQGAIQDRQTQAQLAQAGLATSGAGFGTLQRQQADRNVQVQNAATQAANDAATQAFQADLSTRLQNAGFSLQAQQANAANVLQGNLAGATNYLTTIGLNQQAADQARSSFLQLMGLQESDLQRMDTAQRSNVSSF